MCRIKIFTVLVLVNFNSLGIVGIFTDYDMNAFVLVQCIFDEKAL